MKVPFTKMQGVSNDFILVDELEQEIVPSDKKPGFAVFAADRHTGIGSEGVIFVQKSDNVDAKFVFYNPDGTVAEMDGNGIRCFAKYLYDNGHVDRTNISVETAAGVKSLVLTLFNDKVEMVRVDMGSPQLSREQIGIAGKPGDTYIGVELTVLGQTYKVTCVGTGNPHAVLFVEDVEKVDVLRIGKAIMNMKKEFTRGINVHFVEKAGGSEYKIRSYERGVENETLACGTGACACAVAAVLNGRSDMDRTFVFHARGGDLNVKLESASGKVGRMLLTGPAVEVFKGEMEYEPSEKFQKAANTFISRVLSKNAL
ncbi:MAG: diaminopimelate epimerase [Candidatus Altiarchaeota archaeon]